MNLVSNTLLPDGVRRITLNRPETGNAFNTEMLLAISHSFKTAAQDPRTRVVVLGGAGKHFCAGGDIEWMKSILGASQAMKREQAQAVSDMFQSVHALPQPLVAEVRGAAMGGGFGLLCCADFVVAQRQVRFALSEARLGIVPAAISPYVVAALGVRQANRLALVATPVDAQGALEMGLVTHVSEETDMADTMSALLRELLDSAPGAQQLTKNLFRRMSPQTPDAQSALLAVDALVNAWSQQEASIGFEAFLGKSNPPWRA